MNAIVGEARGDQALECWGGLECTVNRVHDEWFDQIRRTGHDRRPRDIERIASLGIRILRYPFLWEHAQPDSPERDWSWADERVPQLERNGIEPVAGLLHHGSGPRGTDLLDPGFPERLAAYAGEFAARYPGIRNYTPVNEPMTTARFSALYGHWYPHRKSDADFVRCFLNQCRAIVLSMREIRKARPDAELIQTEDLGKTTSAPCLQYQADFENARRWLTWDLLCGRVDALHPMGNWMIGLGFEEKELAWFRENATPPSILGINYYVTSERFLDPRHWNYPAGLRGGNGRDQYADVETVRAAPDQLAGIGTIVSEAWKRYQIPLAITEAHLSCTREEQLRWLWQVWSQCDQARKKGIDIRAVTAWALLGGFDWDCLVTRKNDRYEPGAFDCRTDPPRETAVASMIRTLTGHNRSVDSLFTQPGWWAASCRREAPDSETESGVLEDHPILVLGARGTLGRGILAACRRRNLPAAGLSRTDFDISELHSIRQMLEKIQPRAVINATGYVAVDLAEGDPLACLRLNRTGVRNLARSCRAQNLPLMCFSSDLVFDGQSRRRYVESDRPRPLNVYGFSKACAEREALELWPPTLMIRTSAFFSGYDSCNFAHRLLESLEKGEQAAVAEDVIISPTYVPHLIDIALDLLLDSASGIWHLANDAEVSWFEFARLVAERAGANAAGIIPRSHDQLGWIARRPLFSAMTSQYGNLMPGLESAIDAFLEERKSWLAAGVPVPARPQGNRVPLATASGLPLVLAAAPE